MKKKSKNVIEFMEGLHNHIVKNPMFRSKTYAKNESQIHTEIRPIIWSYLVKYFTNKGFKNPEKKAGKSFYWEGEEGKHPFAKSSVFGARNYADFIITSPYLVAIEYKKAPYGSIVKTGIGQSIIHTMCEEYDFVYFLFQDESKNKKINESINNKHEKFIIDKMWERNNVMIKFV